MEMRTRDQWQILSCRGQHFTTKHSTHSQLTYSASVHLNCLKGKGHNCSKYEEMCYLLFDRIQRIIYNFFRISFNLEMKKMDFFIWICPLDTQELTIYCALLHSYYNQTSWLHLHEFQRWTNYEYITLTFKSLTDLVQMTDHVCCGSLCDARKFN